jgi:internalin A
MKEQVKPKYWRRLLRLSVRGLAVLVLLIGGMLGWAVRSARIQGEAVASIRRARAGITYGSQYLGGTVYDLNTKPWWCPIWLVKQIGIDYFDNPVQVLFVNDTSQCTDVIVQQIAKLGRVEWLAIGSSKITDAGLRHLEKMTSLTRLGLDKSRVSDAGLASLQGLTRLEALDLAYTGIGDAGLAHLNGLTNLISLRLDETRITDEGLRSLRSLTNLAYLDLTDTAISDSAVQELQKALPALKITVLRRSKR